MPYFRSLGDAPQKRHIQFRQPDGRLYVEEMMGEEGFSSDSSLLYHRHSPTTLLAIEHIADAPYPPTKPNSPLKPLHLLTHRVKPGPEGLDDLVQGRVLLLGNDDVHLSYVIASGTSPYYRNAIGDELIYIESGSAVLESVFGRLEVGPGDYVNVPTSTIHRWVVVGDEPVRALAIQSNGHFRPPSRYLSKYGQFLEHAPFTERDLRAPTELIADHADEPTPVIVRHHGGISRHVFAHHPIDVVGWSGCFYPFAFSIHDFEPIVKKTHMPPPIHQTFEAPNVVICSFCPRPFDFHPEAVPVPYVHANVDSDEVVFWVNTDPMSKKYGGIEPGSMTLHPAGFTHGPQPGRTEMGIGRPATDELFVMVDTFRRLNVAVDLADIDEPDYPMTWARGEEAMAREAGRDA